MTPFGRLLRSLRHDSEMAQGEFSKRVGYKQTYISAIERGGRLPKDPKLIDAAVLTLGLDPNNENLLRQAFQLSQPIQFPPLGTPWFAYEICPLIAEVMPKITVSEVEAFKAFLLELQQCQAKRATVRPSGPPKNEFLKVVGR